MVDCGLDHRGTVRSERHTFSLYAVWHGPPPYYDGINDCTPNTCPLSASMNYSKGSFPPVYIP